MFQKTRKLLKKYFIPHKHNNHQPHILRRRSVLIILGITLSAELFFLIQTFLIFKNENFLAAVLPNVLVELTNGNRKDQSISALKISPRLQAAAQMKADDMAEKGYFSHTSPEGVTPWYWFQKAGYAFSRAGENLAVNFFDSGDVNSAWMNSPAHKENIMNMNFTEIGIGIAKGAYQGRESVFIVQLFGSPREEAALVRSGGSAVAAGKSDRQKPIADSAVRSPAPASVLEAEIEKTEAVSGAENFSPQETFDSGSNISNAGFSVPEENFSPARASKAEYLLSRPRLAANYILLPLLLTVFAALSLKTLIKVKIQYFPLILNALLLIAIISLALLFNKYVNIASAGIF